MILVTGAAGFIGRALVKALEGAGHAVFGVDLAEGDLADASVFTRWPQTGLTRVFHLAARTYVPESWKQSQAFLQTNVLGTWNVLDFCARNKVPATLISGYLYGVPETLPIGETTPLKPNNPYALSKRLAESVAEYVHHTTELPITVIRPFNIYGPGQNPEFLIPVIIEQALRSDKIVVQDLAPKRDYLYIDDLARALVKTVECREGFGIYNIGSGESFSVQEIIDLAQEAVGCRKPVESRAQPRQHEIPDVVADITLARDCLAWEPVISMAEGLKKTSDAMRENS